MRFAERVAFVTGGGSGIGRATAAALAAEGARVVVAGRRADALTETVRMIESTGGVAEYATLDVADGVRTGEVVDGVVSRHGRLDVAVNAAGMLAGGTVTGLSSADWDRMLAINTSGVFHCLRHEVRQMSASGGGAIVNVASNLGAHQRRAGLAGYVATKAAVSALTRSAALDHIAADVRINAVSPGPTDTAMSLRPGETSADRAARLATASPIGRVGRLDEVVSAILWLASDDAAYTVGADLVIDGGASA